MSNPFRIHVSTRARTWTPETSPDEGFISDGSLLKSIGCTLLSCRSASDVRYAALADQWNQLQIRGSRIETRAMEQIVVTDRMLTVTASRLTDWRHPSWSARCTSDLVACIVFPGAVTACPPNNNVCWSLILRQRKSNNRNNCIIKTRVNKSLWC